MPCIDREQAELRFVKLMERKSKARLLSQAKMMHNEELEAFLRHLEREENNKDESYTIRR